MGVRVLVTGASGRLGRTLVPRLVAAGHDVRGLSRVGGGRGRHRPHPARLLPGELAVEEQLARSGRPHTILRATQFHDLVLRMFTAQRG